MEGICQRQEHTKLWIGKHQLHEDGIKGNIVNNVTSSIEQMDQHGTGKGDLEWAEVRQVSGQNLAVDNDQQVWSTNVFCDHESISKISSDQATGRGSCVLCSDNIGYLPDETDGKTPEIVVGCTDNTKIPTGIGLAIQKAHKKQSSNKLGPCIVLIGGCINVFLGLGFPLSIGALFVDWLEAFGTTRAETAVIQSTCTGLTFMAGAVVGFLIQRFGVRVMMLSGSIISAVGLFASWFATSHIFLVITVGVILGTGCSSIMFSSNVNVTLAFRDDRVKALALALLATAGGVGSMIFPILLQTLKQIYGWRGALLLASGGYLNVSVSSLMSTSPVWTSSAQGVGGTSVSAKRRKIKWSRLLNPLYFAYLTCAMVGFGTIVATVVTAVDFSISKGLGAQQGIWYLLLINGASTVTRFLTGFILLIPGIKSTHVFCTAFFLCGTSLIVISMSDSYDVITTCFAIYGLGAGGMIPTYSIGILNVVGEEMYAVSMGLGGAVSGISNTTFGIIMGTLYDILGSYDLAFLIFGCMSAGVSILPLLVMWMQSKRHHRTLPISHS